MEERQDKIADGLAAAERGRKELELAQHRVKDELKQAKIQSADIVEKAGRALTAAPIRHLGWLFCGRKCSCHRPRTATHARNAQTLTQCTSEQT